LTQHASAFDQVKTALVLHPAIRGIRQDESSQGSVHVVADTASRTWTLDIVPDPKGLPSIRLVDQELVGRLAHVNYPGIVCVTDQEGLSLDLTRPSAVVHRAVDDALALLERSLQQHLAGDYSTLLDEFEGYWASVPHARPVDVHVRLDEHVREITAFAGPDHRCVAFTERNQVRSNPYAGLRRLTRFASERALYVPLSLSIDLPTPAAPLTAPGLREALLAGLAHTSRPMLDKCLKAWPRQTKHAHVLVSQPRPSGGRSVFGVQFVAKRGGRHPLLEPVSSARALPLVVHRHGSPYLRDRGGSFEELASRHVAVVGCGAIGGRAAEHLALAGVGTLTLVDPDRLEPENFFRHVLGGDAGDMPKVQALKASLERRLPDLTVHAVGATLAEWATPANLQGVDGILLAVGKPHIERAFVRNATVNGTFHGPIVTSWLEALGLGGHAQRTVPGSPGCLECLYTEADGTSVLAPRVSFVRANQPLSRNITGCVGSFTPYSALDATQTAILAVRMLITTLQGTASPSYGCWRGDDDRLARAGFLTTPWYQGLDDAETRGAELEYSRVPCPVCGGTR
jgi:molybdopterin/thiamine biosynthesis adenylyltransferase